MSNSVMPAAPAAPSRKGEWVLLLCTLVWGCTFLLVQHVLAVTGPLFFVGVRFMAAAVVMALVAAPVLRGLTLVEVKAGAVIGLAIAVGYNLQAFGLELIPSSKSAFITALYVPLVPLMQWLVLKKAPGAMSLVGVALAFAGLALLAGPDGRSMGFGLGEILTIVSTLAITAEIILISGFSAQVDARRVTMVQLAVTALLSFAAMPMAGESIPPFSTTLVATGLGLGIASAGIQLAMNWAQKTVSPTRATLIYAGEPVFAGLVGRLAGERLPAAAWLGAALIVVGVVIGEVKVRRRRDGGDAAATASHG